MEAQVFVHVGGRGLEPRINDREPRAALFGDRARARCAAAAVAAVVLGYTLFVELQLVAADQLLSRENVDQGLVSRGLFV